LCVRVSTVARIRPKAGVWRRKQPGNCVVTMVVLARRIINQTDEHDHYWVTTTIVLGRT
jgi:hypothetical protein